MGLGPRVRGLGAVRGVQGGAAVTHSASTASPRLLFEPERHIYTVDGVQVPSVTQVISHAGLVDYSSVPEWMLNFKAQIGTAAHLATELDDDGDLDESSVDPRVLPYVDAYRLFREQSGFEIVSYEQRLYHPRYRYAGTCDRVVRDASKQLGILEIKTTAQHYERAVAIQTVAYWSAFNYCQPPYARARRRYALHLRGDGSYRLHRYDDHARDLAEFLGHLSEMGNDSDAA